MTKEDERKKIEKQLKAFKKSGGEVKKLPDGRSTGRITKAMIKSGSWSGKKVKSV